MISMEEELRDRQADMESESELETSPLRYPGNDKLRHRVAIITGGGSELGRAIAEAFAREGADIVLVYQKNYREVEETQSLVEAEGQKCLTIAGDVGEEDFCYEVVRQTLEVFGQIDILVNNAEELHMQECLENITADQLERTFRTNIFSVFHMTKAVLRHLKPGGTIINTTSEAAFHGEPNLLDYTATMGAIVAFTRSLAKSLLSRNIRVNGVAPGSVWLSVVPAGLMEEERVEKYSSLTRASQPEEIAPMYVFLASADSSHMTGEILHPSSEIALR